MLKSVAFENVINFENYQRLDFENGTNFLIGANSSGKSSILELIRRCLSSEINKSAPFAKDGGFMLSWYDITHANIDLVSQNPMIGREDLLVGVHYTRFNSNDRDIPMCCKSVIFENVDHNCLSFHAVSFEQHVKVHDITSPIYSTASEPISIDLDTSGIRSVRDVFVDNNVQRTVLKFVSEMVSKRPHVTISEDQYNAQPCELILLQLNRYFVSVFPMRGIGPLQWTESIKMRNSAGRENSMEAKQRAEIWTSYWNDAEELDKTLEERLFRTITYPNTYIFHQDGQITHVRDDGENKIFPILKCPEGLLEAKQLSIILANKRFRTIIIENPERGMHTPMIRKMRDLVLRNIVDKIIIVVSHHPAMVTMWTLRCPNQRKKKYKARTFVCRERNLDGRISHEVRPFPDKYSHLAVKEEYKNMLFANNVLLVEGETDKIIFENLFDALVEKGLQLGREEDVQWLTSLSVFERGGKDKAPSALCKEIGINNIRLEDMDAICDYNKEKKVRLAQKYSHSKKGKAVFEKYKTIDEIQKDEKFQNCLRKLMKEDRLFVWKCGNLEDVLNHECSGLTINVPRKGRQEKISFPIKGREKFKKYLKKLPHSEIDKITKKLIESKENKSDSEVKRLLEYLREELMVRCFIVLTSI